MKIVNIVTLILNIIGGINWGLIGLFKFDLVAWICGGQDSVFCKNYLQPCRPFCYLVHKLTFFKQNS